MNFTHLEHIVYAIVIQLAIGLPTANYWIGAAAGIAFFVGREHAQREYQIGNPSTLKPWEGFDIWRWSLDAQLDLILPAVAVIALALGMAYWRRK